MVEITYQMVLSTLQTIALIVGVLYYVTTMRNQNKARQAQLYQGLFNKYSSEETNRHYLNIMQEEWREHENIIDELKPENKEKYLSFCVVSSYYEGIGVLIEENLLDLRPVATTSAISIKWYWETVRPFVERMRIEYPGYAQKSEYLYNRILEYERHHPELKT